MILYSVPCNVLHWTDNNQYYSRFFGLVKFRGVPFGVGPIPWCWVFTERIKHGLISREIIFNVLQSMWPTIPQRHRQTDGRTNCRSNTALWHRDCSDSDKLESIITLSSRADHLSQQQHCWVLTKWVWLSCWLIPSYKTFVFAGLSFSLLLTASWHPFAWQLDG